MRPILVGALTLLAATATATATAHAAPKADAKRLVARQAEVLHTATTTRCARCSRPTRSVLQPRAIETGADLTTLLATPGPTAALLAADPAVFVVGTDKGERATGKAAAKLLATWARLTLAIEGTPREVRTARWGFAQAHVTWTKGTTLRRMNALIIALPQPDGTWKPVGLHYTRAEL